MNYQIVEIPTPALLLRSPNSKIPATIHPLSLLLTGSVISSELTAHKTDGCIDLAGGILAPDLTFPVTMSLYNCSNAECFCANLNYCFVIELQRECFFVFDWPAA